MLEKTGVPGFEDIENRFPSRERLEKGPVAVVECYQNIPCNPCYTACNRNAIQKFADINDLPTVVHDNCNGCSLCIAKCPGLAIMVVDLNWSEDRALLKIPYEFYPLPKVGDIVAGLDRSGSPVAMVEVIRVQNTKALDKTPIISIAVDKTLVKVVRNIGRTDADE